MTDADIAKISALVAKQLQAFAAQQEAEIAALRRTLEGVSTKASPAQLDALVVAVDATMKKRLAPILERLAALEDRQ